MIKSEVPVAGEQRLGEGKIPSVESNHLKPTHPDPNQTFVDVDGLSFSKDDHFSPNPGEVFRQSLRISGRSTTKSWLVGMVANVAKFIKSVDKGVNLRFKGEIASKSTASWWQRYIIKECRFGLENGCVDNTIAGASGTWGLETQTKIESFTTTQEFVSFCGEVIYGMSEFKGLMGIFLFDFWKVLQESNFIKKVLAFVDRKELVFDKQRSWQKFIGRYGSVPVIDSDGKPGRRHLKDLALCLPSATAKEYMRSPEEMSQITLAYYYKTDTGWRKAITILDSKKNLEDNIRELVDNPDGFSDEFDESKHPVFELALVQSVSEYEPNFEEISDDLSGTARRAPFARVVVEFSKQDAEKTGETKIEVNKLRAFFPHYGCNEDTGREFIRKILRILKKNKPERGFVAPSLDEPKILRVQEDKETQKIEAIELAQQFNIPEVELLLMQLAKSVVSKIPLSKNKEPETEKNNYKLRFSQILAAAASTLTTQPTYVCISPKESDLQIGLFPLGPDNVVVKLINEFCNLIKEGEISNLLDKIRDQKFIATRSGNEPVIMGYDITDLRQEIEQYLVFTNDQITDGRDGMALPALLDTFSHERMKSVFRIFFRDASRFIEKCTAQISSVVHDTDSIGGILNFITAASEYAKIAISLKSTKKSEKSKESTTMGLRYRMEHDDLQELAQGRNLNNDEIREMAKKEMDMLLHKELRVRMVLVSYLIILSYTSTDIGYTVGEMEKIREAVIMTLENIKSRHF